MQDLKKRSVTSNKDIKTWKRYVDDVFATVKNDKTDSILHSIKQHDRKYKIYKGRRT